jgi:hypothetical protein
MNMMFSLRAVVLLSIILFECYVQRQGVCLQVFKRLYVYIMIAGGKPLKPNHTI